MFHRDAIAQWQAAKVHYALWTGSFEALVEHHEQETPRRIIIPAAEGRWDAVGQFQNFSDSLYAFGVHALMPDYNDVTYYAEDHLEGFDFDPYLLGIEKPSEILEMADTLEIALTAYENSDRDPDPGSVKAVDYGIRWLRFWGGHGHELKTDVRGVVELEGGTRIMVEPV